MYGIIGASFSPQDGLARSQWRYGVKLGRAGSRLFQSISRRNNPGIARIPTSGDNFWSEHLARQVSHVPKGDLVIPQHAAVAIRATLIHSLNERARARRSPHPWSLPPPTTASADAQVIASHGAFFLMPGL